MFSPKNLRFWREFATMVAVAAYTPPLTYAGRVLAAQHKSVAVLSAICCAYADNPPLTWRRRAR